MSERNPVISPEAAPSLRSSYLLIKSEPHLPHAAGRSIFVLENPGHAGHELHKILVDDLDSHVSEIASRGISPAERETYSNGVRKAIYRDADGNEIGFGGAPA